MNTTNFNFFSRNVLLGASATLLVFSLTSYAKKIKFLASSVVPSARGQVIIKKYKNENYEIKIKIDELAEVQKVEPSKNMYIVWMESEKLMVKNMGYIVGNSGAISSKLKAGFKTITAFKPTKIFITAEDNANIPYPINPFILETTRF
ncbi:MAG: hypothetical protein GZ087_09630 [Flavobacterium sp.]|nr:hypothetical protein [Flavobacterium sp.]